MRYHELFEDRETNNGFRTDMSNMSIDQLWMGLEHECSDALSIAKSTGRFFYRGTVDDMFLIYKGRIRDNRMPTNTPREVQQRINDWMQHNGFRALRTNSLFVTTDLDQAKSYGTPFIIFPKNGFAFTWFQNSKDLYHSMVRDTAITGDGEPPDHNQLTDYFDDDRNLDEFMRSVGPRNDNIQEAMQKGVEIMISGVDYYAISPDLLDDVKHLL